MKTVIIVQARMTSTRLPKKVLKEVLGKPLLEYQIERLKTVKLANDLIIATTINKADEPIVDLCNKLSIKCFRGSEEDVLSRYYYSARESQADIVVRVTSDCPLIDPNIIDRVLKFYLDSQPKYDYVSNTLMRTYPRGMDTEVFSFQVLEEAFLEGIEPPEREHVTPFIYHHPERYKLFNLSYGENQSEHRWTVDTPEDFELIRLILESIYTTNNFFTLEDCLNLLIHNPDWSNMNSHIEQKQYGE